MDLAEALALLRDRLRGCRRLPYPELPALRGKDDGDGVRGVARHAPECAAGETS